MAGDHDGDFCSKGFPEKKGEPDKGLKVNPLGVTLTGCPLDEKISEMHLLKKSGHAIAAHAMITVDNPMCAAGPGPRSRSPHITRQTVSVGSRPQATAARRPTPTAHPRAATHGVGNNFVCGRVRPMAMCRTAAPPPSSPRKGVRHHRALVHQPSRRTATRVCAGGRGG